MIDNHALFRQQAAEH